MKRNQAIRASIEMKIVPSESGSVLQYTAYNYTEHSSNGSGFMDFSTSSQAKYVARINGRNPRYK